MGVRSFSADVLRGARVALIAMLVSRAVYAQTPARPTASLSGVVRDLGGTPLSDVNVTLVDESFATRTDSAGRFVLYDVPAGAHTTLFRRIGYRSVEYRWTAQADRGLQIAVTMTPVPRSLDRVVVEAPAIVGELQRQRALHRGDERERIREGVGAGRIDESNRSGAARRLVERIVLEGHEALEEGSPARHLAPPLHVDERRVLVIAYDDGVHSESPAVVVNFDHFERIDQVDGFELCRRAEDLPRLFVELATRDAPPSTPLREQLRWWLHHDADTYADRLARLVDELAPAGAATPRDSAGLKLG